MIRFGSVEVLISASGAGVGAGVPTSWPGEGGGGGTSGRATLGVDIAMAGVAIDGVGRAGYGVPDSGVAFNVGVGRRNPGRPEGAGWETAGVHTGEVARGVIAGLVNGVVAPTLTRRIAPQTLHRARTPFGGTLAGSTRKIDRQS